MEENNNQVIVDIGVDALIASLRELQKQYEANTAAMKAMRDEGKQDSDEYIQLTQANKVLRQEMGGVEKSIQNNIKAEKAQEGSLVQLRAQLANLNKQYDSMSGFERMGTAGEELRKKIKALSDNILGLEGDTGRMQRNVGNYPAAMKPVTAAIREMQQELIKLRLEGKENTEEYQQLLEETGKLKDAMADTSREVNQMASDTGTLNSVMDGAKLTAGAFSTALGVLNLVGGEDSKTAKQMADAQRKLQSAIAITTGLQSVQNAIQKESALMLGITKLQTLAAAKAGAVYNKEQGKYVITTGAATVAQKAFNAVANANPYVLLATAILTVVGALVAFTKGTQESEEQQVKLNNELARQLDLLERISTTQTTISTGKTKKLQNELSLLREQGATQEELLTKEGEILDVERKAIQNRKWQYQDLIAEQEKYEENLKTQAQAIKTASDLEQINLENAAAYTGALRKGYADRAEEYRKQKEAAQEQWEATKNVLDIIHEINAAEENNANQRAILDAKWVALAKKSEEEQTKKAEEEAKKRQELWKNSQEERARYARQTVTEMQKAEDAINQIIEDGYEQRRAIENTAYNRKKDELEKNMAAEAMAFGTETDLYKAYASQLESLKVQHERKMSAITQDQINDEKELRQRAIEQTESDNELYWETRINEALVNGKKAGEIELQMLKDKLDKMQQYTDESDAAYYNRRLEAQAAYNEKKKELDEQEMAMERAKQEYAASIAGSISQTMEAVAGENEELVKASKVVALAEVAIKQGVAIAEAVAASAAGDPYTYALRVASAVASTVAAMAQAIASINGASFETGGVIGGYRGATMGSDNTYIHARQGEMVLNAEQQRQLFDIANGGYSSNMMAQLVEAIQSMPAPVLDYKEFTAFQRRVVTLTENAKLK